MEKVHFHYKPHYKGLTQVLGSLEKEIMEILWRKGESTGRSLSEEIQCLHAAAYTTVLTVAGRLVKKGLIRKDKKDGVYVFSPVCSKKEFNEHIAREVIQGLKKLSSDSSIANFIDILSEVDDKRIKEYIRILEENKFNLSSE